MMYFSIRTYFSEPSCGYCFSTKPVDLLEKQGFQKGTIIYFKLVHLLFWLYLLDIALNQQSSTAYYFKENWPYLMIGCSNACSSGWNHAPMVWWDEIHAHYLISIDWKTVKCISLWNWKVMDVRIKTRAK